MQPPTMTRRGFLASTAAVATGAALAGAEAGRPRPNMLLITTDQQHWTALGAADPFFSTPAIDRLAREGTVFDHAFCTTPQCSASRASLYTGLYPHKTSVITNLGCATSPNAEQEPLPPRFETIGSRLRAAGYRTGYFGKWHLGSTAHYGGHFDRADLDGDSHGGATDKALAAMRDWAAAPERPFCACVNYLNPHDVYQFTAAVKAGNARPAGAVQPFAYWAETFSGKPSPQREYAEKDQAAFLSKQPDTVWEAYREFYRDKVRLADAEIGRLLDHLDKSGLGGNTVVLFTADHGDMDTHHRLVFKGPFMYEQLVRVPFIVRMPGGAPGTVDRFVTTCDVLPTLCAMAGAEAGETDGLSLAAGLAGGVYPDRPFVVGQYHSKQKWVNPIRMHRTRDWKYNRYLVHGEELYDLKNDPEEMVNLAADPGHQARKAEFSDALDQWMARNEDTAFAGYRPTHRDGTPFSG